MNQRAWSHPSVKREHNQNWRRGANLCVVADNHVEAVSKASLGRRVRRVIAVEQAYSGTYLSFLSVEE